jgi:hypothetical protein
MKKILFFSCLTILFLSIYSFAHGNGDSLDTDQDGISDYDEVTIYHTNPNYYDTDGDGWDDGAEIEYLYSPLHANGRKMVDVDSDGDGLNDKWELAIGTDILTADTDGDGYSDNEELIHNYNPRVAGGARANKFIKVDITEQNLAYYFDGKLLDSFPISGGVASMPTPLGEFTILNKVPSKDYGGSGYNFYYPGTKWNMHFTTDYWRYYIHGAYWHENFGNPMSHGCVNVSYEHMERLYEFTDIGTKVLIHK